MKRNVYSPELRQKFVAAATEARANGRGWDEALMLAKDAGYKGGLPGLRKLVRDSKKGVGTTPKRGPGRPRKNESAGNGNLSQVEAVINGIVRDRMKTMIAKIRVALDEAEKQV